MATSTADSWDRARKTFADQFEQDGTSFVYRRSQKGEAIRVSAEERSKFIDEFDRDVRRAKWIIDGGLILVLGSIVGLSLLRGSDFSQAAIFVGIGLVTVPYFAYYHWAWGAPARELSRRTPIAAQRSQEEVQRMRFSRMRYGQLAGAAVGGLTIPFIASSGSYQDAFSGWNRLWLVLGGGVVFSVAVLAFRKRRFEQEDSLRNVIPRSSTWAVTNAARDATARTKGQFWRYLPLAMIVLMFALVALTPAGKRLAQLPSFWSVFMIGAGAWSIVTVVRGFAKGQIEPFARGFYKTYERATEPKRFWASLTWNAVFGALLMWLAFKTDDISNPVEDSCYAGRLALEDRIAACNQLVKEHPRDSHAYLNRGLVYLDNSKFDPAIADFTKAHELDPKSAWPVADRGMAYAWKNDRARAEGDFSVVRRIDPANPVVLHGEAMLSMNEGDLETAIDKLTTALKINSSDTWSLQTRADAYQQRGDFELARADRHRLQQLSN